MNPRAILDRMARRYREAEGYHDSGEHRIEGDPKPLVSKFSTAYTRGRGMHFRFRFGNRAMDIDVVADAAGNLSRVRGLDALPPTLAGVLVMGAAPTFLTTLMVPPLLFSDLLAGKSVTETLEPRWTGWEEVDGESCHVLAVQLSKVELELLVSEKRFLIRAFHRRGLFPRMPESLLLATYHPKLFGRASSR